jgi:hypothetical protein
LYKFEKEVSKKEKLAKFLKPQKLKKTKTKQALFQTFTNQRHISFLCLDNETVETRYQLMVGFKVVS